MVGQNGNLLTYIKEGVPQDEKFNGTPFLCKIET